MLLLQVTIAVKGAFNICYKEVIQTTGKDEETLLQCAYSEVLGSQKRADVRWSKGDLKSLNE